MLEKAVIENRVNLEETIKSLESKPDYVDTEKLQKTIKLIKDNIETAKRALEKADINKNEVNTVRKYAHTLIKDME